MGFEAHSGDDTTRVTSVQVGRNARVIALRGAIRGHAVEDLRDQLLSAIEMGAREVFLDLSEIESVCSPVHDIVSAASRTLADRGGVLLAWSRKYTLGEPTYVIAEVRDRALSELLPRAKGRRRDDRGAS